MSIILGLLIRLIEKVKFYSIWNLWNESYLMFSTPTVVRKINNDNNKGYVSEKLNEEMNSVDAHDAEAILDSFKFKKLWKLKTDESLQGREV